MTQLLHDLPQTPKVRSPWPRRCLLTVATLVGIYAGINFLVLPFEDTFVYRTVRPTEAWVRPPSRQVRDITIQTANGTRLDAWWYRDKDWNPSQGAILFCHGNATNLSQWGARMEKWHEQLGQAVLMFDYPGYGRSDGTPSEASLYAAADAAYDWLVQKAHVPPSRLLVCGESLGGGVAVDLASRRPHRALVLLSTFTSIPAVAQHLEPWLPAVWLMHNRFDSLAKIGHCSGPVFIAHGTADPLVPCWQGERLFEAAHEPKCFLKLEGAGHDHRPDDQVRARVRKFLDDAETRMAVRKDTVRVIH